MKFEIAVGNIYEIRKLNKETETETYRSWDKLWLGSRSVAVGASDSRLAAVCCQLPPSARRGDAPNQPTGERPTLAAWRRGEARPP
jgi:hypothetical protein